MLTEAEPALAQFKYPMGSTPGTSTWYRPDCWLRVIGKVVLPTTSEQVLVHETVADFPAVHWVAAMGWL